MSDPSVLSETAGPSGRPVGTISTPHFPSPHTPPPERKESTVTMAYGGYCALEVPAVESAVNGGESLVKPSVPRN
jgi:hypothetical protein